MSEPTVTPKTDTEAQRANELGPVSPGDVKVYRMFYTSCPLCGALNDWSDTRVEANRNRRAHIKAHSAPLGKPDPR